MSFERAKKDVHFRQRYLDEVDFGDFTPFISDVRYACDQEQIGLGESLMDARCIPDGRTDIRVYAAAFSDPIASTTEENFLSNLVDHEGKHAEQNRDACQALYSLAEDRFIVQHGLINLLRISEFTNPLRLQNERRAYRYPLNRFYHGFRDITPEHEGLVSSWLEFYELVASLPIERAAELSGVPALLEKDLINGNSEE